MKKTVQNRLFGLGGRVKKSIFFKQFFAFFFSEIESDPQTFPEKSQKNLFFWTRSSSGGVLTHIMRTTTPSEKFVIYDI